MFIILYDIWLSSDIQTNCWQSILFSSQNIIIIHMENKIRQSNIWLNSLGQFWNQQEDFEQLTNKNIFGASIKQVNF